jgi:hypothetical protein
MDLTAETARRDTKIINELLSGVTHRIDSTNSPYGLKQHQRPAVTGDAWIRKPKHLVGTQKSSTNCYHGLRRDLTAQTAPRDSYITNELLSRVSDGCDSPNSP